MDGAESELRSAAAPRAGTVLRQAASRRKPEGPHRRGARHDAVGATWRGAPQPAAGSEFPWGLVLFGILLVAAIGFFVRAMNRRNATVIPAGYGYGPGGGMQPMGAGMAAPMGPMGGTMGGGMGSGIVGGLATGAAIGAGMVAGEALMHHFTDGDRPAGNTAPPASGNDALPNDMGGNDFGVADGGSWDDSSGGGSDWS